MYAPSVAWPSLHTALLCPPAVFLAGFVRLILLRSLLLDFPCATPAKPIALNRSFLKVRYVGRMAQPPHCPPVPTLTSFVRLILLRSLLLDFPCAAPAKPIALDLLFLKVRSVGRMAKPPHCPPVPTLTGFVRLIHLRSILLDFLCVTPATPIAQDLLFLNVRYVRCVCLLSWNL